MLRGAFTAEECDQIAAIFVERAQPEEDVRQYEGVARLNRWDVGKKLMRQGFFDAFYTRVVERTIEAVGREMASALFPDVPDEAAEDGAAGGDLGKRFRELVEFNLMHEFDDSKHSYFGWHVDTKPNDGTWRTLNLNVMLSSPTVEFQGGALQVGAQVVATEKGDAYLYPAAFPHIVHDLQRGRRRTYIVALSEKPALQLGGGKLTALPRRFQQYWTAMEASLDALAAGALKDEPKFHLIRGDFLDATGRHAEARLAFCEQYRVSPQAKDYAKHFFADGAAALRREPPNLPLALDMFDFAARVDPEHSEAAAALQKVRERLKGK